MKKVRTDFASLFSEHEKDFKQYFQGLVQIPSVKGNKTYQAPFGIGPKRALDYMLNLADQLGFRTGQVDNRVGWAEIGPEDDQEYFAILGHLDVVDVDDDWSYPPFDLTEKNGYFYGRGVLDNKGPFLASFLALWLIKQQNKVFKKRVRVMFGTDEESGSQDLPAYLEKNQPPYAGFTPDCKFPIVYGERGLLDVTVEMPITDDSLQQIKQIKGNFNSSFLPDFVELETDGGTNKFTGTKAPSNAPDLADNVLPKLVSVGTKFTGQTGDFFRWLDQKISDQSDGKNLGLNFEDEFSGTLQLSFYALKKGKDNLSFSVSMRYPVTIPEDKVLRQLQSQLTEKMRLTINRQFPSLLRDKNLPYMQQFSQIYHDDTGLDGTPVTTTGVTYARSLPNIVAFGPSFPGQKGIAHKGDEWLKYSDWQMMMEIYYDCLIAELC